MTAPDASASKLRETNSSAFFDEGPARAAIRPLAEGEGWQGIRAERLELVSRGDVVSGLLARAERSKTKSARSRSALVLAVHDSGGSASSPELGIAARWVGPDLSLVSVDLPLHGHRASPKLSERLVAGLARQAGGEAIDRNGAVLVEEFWRQATIDLARTLDAALALGGLDPKRIGLVGIGLGAALVEALLAQDARPRAAILVRPPISRQGSSVSAKSVRQTAPHRGSDAPAIGEARAAAERLRIETEADPEVWGPAARAFLEARLGSDSRRGV